MAKLKDTEINGNLVVEGDLIDSEGNDIFEQVKTIMQELEGVSALLEDILGV